MQGSRPDKNRCGRWSARRADAAGRRTTCKVAATQQIAPTTVFIKQKAPWCAITPGVFRFCSPMPPSRHHAHHFAVAKDECEHTLLPTIIYIPSAWCCWGLVTVLPLTSPGGLLSHNLLQFHTWLPTTFLVLVFHPFRFRISFTTATGLHHLGSTA